MRSPILVNQAVSVASQTLIKAGLALGLTWSISTRCQTWGWWFESRFIFFFARRQYMVNWVTLILWTFSLLWDMKLADQRILRDNPLFPVSFDFAQVPRWGDEAAAQIIRPSWHQVQDSGCTESGSMSRFVYPSYSTVSSVATIPGCTQKAFKSGYSTTDLPLFNATMRMKFGIGRLTEGDELHKPIERMFWCAIFAAERDAKLRRLRAHNHDQTICLLQLRDSKTVQPGCEYHWTTKSASRWSHSLNEIGYDRKSAWFNTTYSRENT